MQDRTWAALVPELICTSLAASREFYCDVIGFTVRFERVDDNFAYLDLDGAQLMLDQQHPDSWVTGELDRPLGRGVNFQIEVASLQPLRIRLQQAGIPVFQEPEEVWYREDDVQHGQMEMLVQDPDGYLLRFVEVLGTRPAPRAAE